jgi:nicotinate-nucleotide adenylyltransferase
MRVGLFGGSFNPIHLGHLRAAEEDREALGLDLVYFIPAASPPHKPSGDLAPAEHRLAMVRLATKGPWRSAGRRLPALSSVSAPSSHALFFF